MKATDPRTRNFEGFFGTATGGFMTYDWQIHVGPFAHRILAHAAQRAAADGGGRGE